MKMNRQHEEEEKKECYEARGEKEMNGVDSSMKEQKEGVYDDDDDNWEDLKKISENDDDPSNGGDDQQTTDNGTTSSSKWSDGPPPLSTLNLSSDNAFGHPNHHHSEKEHRTTQSLKVLLGLMKLIGSLLRFVILDLGLMLLFALYVAALLLHRIHDDYLLPQLKLMKFLDIERDYTDTTYYHRVCGDEDVTAHSVDELLVDISSNETTTQDAVESMLKHGVSMYPNLLSSATSWELREFIAEENHKQDGWFVIENKHRYSWGIDMDMHPALRKYWKELAANRPLVEALEAIVGPDPAIIEFTAITSAYGAVDQFDHQDVVPPASGAKFARTFVPSYSLFIPLQDTSYDMGATHVCPGTHLCSAGCDNICPKRNLAVSDAFRNESDGTSVWPQGWGAFVNQQTTHKGMGHFKKGGLDRVVLIATFAPRPEYKRGLETRMLGQGGSYSIKWDHYGHTFSDFVYSETRMTRIKRIMRSFGLLKGNGWNIISVASMRISNNDNGYDGSHTLNQFRKEGGFPFLPKSWQGKLKDDEVEDDNIWYKFLIGTLKRTERELEKLYVTAIQLYGVMLALVEVSLFLWWLRVRSNRDSSNWSLSQSFAWSGIRRLIITHGLVSLVAFGLFYTVRESNWAKEIRSGKAYNLPVYEMESDELPPETIPIQSDILIAPQYSSDYLASYARVLDYSHPGNLYWMDLTKEYSRGFVTLSDHLQQQFCSDLIRSIQSDRRILRQDLGRSWIAVEEEEELLHFCRKGLVMARNSFDDVMVRQIESLRTEAHYGRFHNTTMALLVTPEILDKWENRFISRYKLSKPNPKQPLRNSFLHPSILVGLVQIPISQGFSLQRQALPLRPLQPKEPYKGAWLQTGDIIEGKYNCKFNEWYKGTVQRAFASSGRYTVEYEDGEVDEDLKKKCVRRYKPYKVGEFTEVADTDDRKNYFTGKVVKIYAEDEEVYDIQTDESGLFRLVPTSRMRRAKKKSSPFEVGDKVYGLYDGDDEWFPARIEKKYKDGTYKLLYDDGDYEDKVQQQFIQKME